MKLYSISTIIILIASFIHFSLEQCIYSYSETTSSLDDCSDQILFDSSMPSTFPSQCKEIHVTIFFENFLKGLEFQARKSFHLIFSFKFLMLLVQAVQLLICLGFSKPILFIKITYRIYTGLGMVTLLSVEYAAITLSPITFGWMTTFEDILGPNTLFTAPSTNSPDMYTDYELAGTIDLTYQTSELKVYFAFVEEIRYEEAGPRYSSDWVFDSSTRIFICSDFAGNPSYYCSILAFNYWFTNPPDLISFTGQLIPSLTAKYLFKEGSGYQTSDFGTLGTAYFGNSGPGSYDPSNSPIWLSSQPGIRFTSANQFIMIKTFSLSPPPSQYDVGSLTITFWLQRTRNNGGGYIFRYSNSDLSYDYFFIKISDDGFVTAAINQQIATTTTQILSATWTLVSVTYALHPVKRDHYIIINIGESSAYSQSVSAIAPSFAYNTLDKVHIGGPDSFKGSISDFRIYSPGSSAIIHKTSCSDSSISSSCLLSLGKLDGNKCLTFSCFTHCLTCFDQTASGCLSCDSGYSLINSQCIADSSTTPKTPTPVLSQTTTDTIKGSQKSAQAATQVVNAVTAGSPSGVSAAIGGKIFFNIKFLNISYAENLEEALTSWNSNFISLGLTPDLPTSITSKIPKEDVPYVFDKRQVPSSFLENFWESLGMLLFVAFIYAGVLLLELTLAKFPYKYLPRHLLFAARAIVQNFLLAQLYSVFGDMLFFAILEFRAPNTHHKWSRLSLASGIILLFFMLIILGLHLRLLKRYQNVRKANNTSDLTQFENANKGSNVLFGDFKDISIVRQSFLLFLTGRDLLFSLLLTTMFDHPLIECIFILVLNLAMVAYLLLLPPFKSTFDATQQLFYEIITLAVNVSVLILAIMDTIDSPDDPGFRSQIGRFIIIVNVVFNFGSLAFMLVKASQTLYQIYKAYKERKSKHKTHLKLQTPERLTKTEDSLSHKIDSKFHATDDSTEIRAPIKEPIEFELNQTISKPLDLTDESFVMKKEALVISHRTPKFDTIQSPFDQTQEDNLLSQHAHQTLDNSSLFSNQENEEDAKVDALKEILAKNEQTRKMRQFQVQLNRARSTHRVTHQPMPKLFQFEAKNQQS